MPSSKLLLSKEIEALQKLETNEKTDALVAIVVYTKIQ
jgi:hypothetical protein